MNEGLFLGGLLVIVAGFLILLNAENRRQGWIGALVFVIGCIVAFLAIWLKFGDVGQGVIL